MLFAVAPRAAFLRVCHCNCKCRNNCHCNCSCRERRRCAGSPSSAECKDLNPHPPLRRCSRCSRCRCCHFLFNTHNFYLIISTPLTPSHSPTRRPFPTLDSPFSSSQTTYCWGDDFYSQLFWMRHSQTQYSME